MSKCNHIPDWKSVFPADGAPGIVDVWCTQCGLSGSIPLALEDIQWGDEDENEEDTNKGR